MAFRKIVTQRLNYNIDQHIGKAGDIFYTEEGKLRVSDGVTLGGEPITGAQISTTAPTSPNSGDIWFNPDTNELSVYYIDGEIPEWVSAGGGGGSGARGFTGSRGSIGFTGSSGFAGSQGVGFAGSAMHPAPAER